MSKQRAKGTAAETAVVNYLNAAGFNAIRNPLHGANDKGDIHLDGIPVVIEVKNCVKIELSEWLKEAEAEKLNAKARSGVVWHKRKGKSSPGDWYVTMDGATFLDYLEFVENLHK